MSLNANLTFHKGSVSIVERERLLGQRGCIVWLTGLSGAGKSTIAHALEAELYEAGKLVYVLDGDNIRHGLNADLGFSDADRKENIRRSGEVSALFVDAGLIVVTAFISPFREDRERVKAIVGAERFLEVYVEAPLEICEKRDPKGLYRKARAGAIAEFTGISSLYEPPLNPSLIVRTAQASVVECANQIRAELDHQRFLDSVDSAAPQER